MRLKLRCSYKVIEQSEDVPRLWPKGHSRCETEGGAARGADFRSALAAPAKRSGPTQTCSGLVIFIALGDDGLMAGSFCKAAPVPPGGFVL